MILSPPQSGEELREYMGRVQQAVNAVASVEGDNRDIAVDQEANRKVVHFIGKIPGTKLFAVRSEEEDALVCREVFLGNALEDPEAIPYVSKTDTYVAKPWELRRTPWHGYTTSDGEVITQAFTSSRAVYKADFHGNKTEEITPKYYVENGSDGIHSSSHPNLDRLRGGPLTWPCLILAHELSSECEIVVNNKKYKVHWQDMNMAGRHWDIPIGSSDPYDATTSTSPHNWRGIDPDGTTHQIEGDEDADGSTWTVDAQPALKDGVKIPLMTRWVYKHDGDEKLYGFFRWFTWDVKGRLYGWGAETRYEIDTPVEC